MKEWEYKDYDEYVDNQKTRWKSQKWKKKDFGYYNKITKPLRHIIKDRSIIKSVVCQGVRNTAEVEFMGQIFKRAKIYGTDIGFEDPKHNILKMDFNKCPDDWTDKFDLLFSNSVDHAFGAMSTLKEWKRITKQYMIIQFSGGRAKSSPSDPFTISSQDDIKFICEDVGLEILDLQHFVLTAKVLR